MTIEELAKLKANSIPNSTLVKYYEAGIPQWHMETILTMLKPKKLSVLQEFILKFISSGIDDISDICNFLGVNKTAVNNAVGVDWEKADIYSLAKTILYILSGSVISDLDCLDEIEGLDDDLKIILMEMLDEKPENRPKLKEVLNSL